MLSIYSDSSSLLLLGGHYEKRLLANATLTVRKASGEAFLDYPAISMTDVVIAECDIAVEEEARLTRESLLLCPAAFRLEYTVQEEDSSQGATYRTSVDLQGETVSESAR